MSRGYRALMKGSGLGALPSKQAITSLQPGASSRTLGPRLQGKNAPGAGVNLSQYVFEPLRRDDEFILCRGQHASEGGFPSILVLAPACEHPSRSTLNKIEYEYSLRHELDPAWAVRPLALSEQRGQKVLVLEDPGGDTLLTSLSGRMETGHFLRVAIGLASALAGLHGRRLIHKNVTPAHALITSTTGQVRLMGFGIASRLPRERQSPDPPELIAGTLSHMAPEQTGRMNRSVDSRSDLYSLGITLYQSLPGHLPFTATDPLAWVHCHVARLPAPPNTRVVDVPSQLSAVIMKLLAKTPEERYQTAAAVERDLRRCLADWDTQHVIEEFPLAEHDLPDRLLIPERLYGREGEIAALVAAFDNVVASGKPALVLVSGHPGIGKSSVVSELHKVLVPPRGLFASGKFDQLRRDVPYATIAQGFQSLIRQLLRKPDAELNTWREPLRQALAPNRSLPLESIPDRR